ncbi:hypothetical protein [Luteimonas deserti]|uniref:Uncharacterized protein n=1 Tax=Luteimonas deserti TaxID=2752306 RepID=A0A7Z0QRQ2_9GAMM|nr:hypothetical protein [Luteimonas deserti]NYZ63627.1 hypothetical protein [Luteimonas deserti]
MLVLLGLCALIGLPTGASLMHVEALAPPSWFQQWRASGPISCDQALWVFGPSPLRALSYLTGSFVACLLLAWITLSLPRGGNPGR